MHLLPLTIVRTAARLAHGVLLSGLLLMGCCTASASTRYIATYGSDNPNCGASIFRPCRGIQYTISHAVSGDLLRIGPGIFRENIVINKNLTLIGAPWGFSILDGGQAGTVVTVASSVTSTLQSVTIANGHAALSFVSPLGAGGIDNSGTLKLSHSWIIANTASDDSGEAYMGAGILNEGTLNIDSSYILANNGSGACTAGGGILNLLGGTLSVKDTVISQNTATGPSYTCNEGPFLGPVGAAIYNQGTAVLNTSTISHNKTSSDYASITNVGDLALFQSTISNNPEYGVWNGATGAFLELVNTTVARNLFGVMNQFDSMPGFSSGFVSVANSTISKNKEGGLDAGGVLGFGPPSSSLQLDNSIVAENGGVDCAGFITGDYNLIATSTCTVKSGGTHNQMGAAADLSPLRYNGGETFTMSPRRQSRAIRAGNPAGCMDYLGNPITVDQRGFGRPDPSIAPCTIGAVEVQQQ